MRNGFNDSMPIWQRLEAVADFDEVDAADVPVTQSDAMRSRK